MKRDLPFWLLVAASAVGLAVVVIVVVAGDGGPSLPAALGAAVGLVAGWTAVVVRARQGRPDDRGAAGPTAPGPPARLVLSRGDDSAGMMRHIRVTVDGELVALLKPRTVAEVDVPPGRHRVRASMDWTTSGALDLDLVPGERVEIRTGLPLSMIWRMVTAPGDTLTIERIGSMR
ncbi:hypothetical protein [Cellulomonas sp. Y8]|uniref:hypothetical protein n=1 Tax=Cellulomonas sp. Y8 TaxID=2591145 RepID=UPI0011C88554|nr:hypothetical protein [Cellulomonas sp. Y8]